MTLKNNFKPNTKDFTESELPTNQKYFGEAVGISDNLKQNRMRLSESPTG